MDNNLKKNLESFNINLLKLSKKFIYGYYYDRNKIDYFTESVDRLIGTSKFLRGFKVDERDKNKEHFVKLKMYYLKNVKEMIKEIEFSDNDSKSYRIVSKRFKELEKRSIIIIEEI